MLRGATRGSFPTAVGAAEARMRSKWQLPALRDDTTCAAQVQRAEAGVEVAGEETRAVGFEL